MLIFPLGGFVYRVDFSWVQHLLGALLLCCATLAAADGAYKPSGSTARDDTLIFGIHPYTNPQDLFEAYNPIARYLENKLPGTKFQIEASKDYADYEAKLAARRFHFAMPNPYETLLSLDHGYRVIAKMTPDDDFRGLIVARADKKIPAPRDLAGKPLCFPSPTAVAGTMLPMLYLADHGLKIDKEQVRFVGSQFSSILNAYSGDALACGSTVRFWRLWSRDNPDKAKEMTVLWKTEALPHNGIVVRDDVAPQLAQQVASTLAGMDKDKDLDPKQFKADQAHFELAANATYKPMLEFLKRYEQALGLPGQMKARSNTFK
ncbi:MAG: phosphate/phosphite/phosphonate ABC transporter substrate-binding protein [Sulfuricella sp.]|nr:phosphate/phosphite/phosphonate ABC transporter substrate-binding protein [Sulfuricella sp.]